MMMDPKIPYVCAGEDVTSPDMACLGGKGSHLAQLGALGQPVPPWYGVTTEAFRGALESAGLQRRIAARLADLDPAAAGDLAAAAEAIQGWIRELELPAELERLMAEAHERSLPGDGAVAVRSSAVDEDGFGDSFAGLHDSVLFVCGHSATVAALKQVWASAYSRHALAYRMARGLSSDDVAMAVVVQRMVPAVVSGVLFTADPGTADVHKIVISALYGLGEGLVGGQLEADRFTVDKASFEIEASIATKSEQLVDARRSTGGLRRVPVPEADRDKSSLSESQVLALARAGRTIESHYGCPQDIEFAMGGDGEIAILQSRPITTLDEDGPAAGNPVLWDNRAWVENLSGVVSPMTFSVTRRTGNIAARFMFDLLGIDETVIRSHPLVFDVPVGYVRGRLYSSKRTGHQLYRFIPGAHFNWPWFASLLGVEDGGEDGEGALGRRRRYFVELPALLRLAGRVVRNLLSAPRQSELFQKRARALYTRCAAMDFNAMKAHELVAFYEEVERELIVHWKAPQINGFYTKAFYALLKVQCRAWCHDATGSLQNDLLRGEEGVRSVEPVHQQLRLARKVRQDPELSGLFATRPAQEVAEIVSGDPRYAEFAAEIARYLDLYFFKCRDEMKLEAYSLRDRPAELYRMIHTYATRYTEKDLDVEARQGRERRARQQAEARALAALGAPVLGFLKRRLFRWAMNNARLGVKNRENIKLIRLQLIGLFRELVQALGRRLSEGGVLEEPRDVFYLTLEEVFAYVRGTAVTTRLGALAALRREEIGEYLEDDENSVPDESFETYGMVYHRNRFKKRRREQTEAGDGVLRGTGSCQGRVTAPVRVMRSPEEDARLAGEILVIPSVRTSWALLFPAISGLLIERGEVLSHTATLAREMGIPTVVGIPGLLASLRSGQQVTMDGATGTVEVLSADGATPTGR